MVMCRRLCGGWPVRLYCQHWDCFDSQFSIPSPKSQSQSLDNYASTFELHNEMSVYDSYGDNVKQFISKVQNFEQNKILQNGEDKLHDMQIRAEGTTRGKRRKRRRKKKRKTTANYPAMTHSISSLEMSKIRKFIKSVCRTTRSREVSKYCNENLQQ